MALLSLKFLVFALKGWFCGCVTRMVTQGSRLRRASPGEVVCRSHLGGILELMGLWLGFCAQSSDHGSGSGEIPSLSDSLENGWRVPKGNSQYHPCLAWSQGPRHPQSIKMHTGGDLSYFSLPWVEWPQEQCPLA